MNHFIDELDRAVAAAVHAAPRSDTEERLLTANRERAIELSDAIALLFSEVALRYSQAFEFVDHRAPAEDSESMTLVWKTSEPVRMLIVEIHKDRGEIEWAFSMDATAGRPHRLSAAETDLEDLQALVLALVRQEQVTPAA